MTRRTSLSFVRFSAVVVLISAVFFAGPTGNALAADSQYTLDNGMQVILKENHSSPMTAAIIFVKSGSKYESVYENGITHFLEHLLFDGTASKSRSELDQSISDLGGYINAFTREDQTTFLVLLPREYIEYGLTVQADMLFNSVFPENEMAKERQVVIEEINSDADQSGYAPEGFFRVRTFANTDYSRPVLGYKEFIERIPREAVIDYWKRYYTPDNMVTLVIGDFATDSMKTIVERVFGKYPSATKADTASAGPLNRRQKALEEKRRDGALSGAQRYDTVANVTSTYVDFSISGPRITDKDYLPFDLLTSYLSLDEISPLHQALLEGETPLVTEMGLSLTTYEEFTRLDISLIADSSANPDTIIAEVTRQLATMTEHEASPKTVQGIKTSIRCDAIYNAEKLHYYGFMIAPYMMAGGWDFIQSYPDRIDSVNWSDCQRVAEKWLSEPDYIVTVVTPADSIQTAYLPTGPGEAAVATYFDTAQFPEYDLISGHEIEYPNVDSVSLTLTDKSVYAREVLPDGLTVLVKSNPDSRVFAVNILGKNRTASEPDSLAGITDFVNRCLGQGTTTRDGSRLTEDLATIGANLTLNDNQWIPYDDRYTTRSYSFIKFETIEDFAEAGFDLLMDILHNPAFDTTDIEQVRREMQGILMRDATSPSKVARQLFYETYFAGTPFANPIMGTAGTLAAITRDDLVAHHRRFYAPDNIIMSIVTSRDTSEVLAWVRAAYAEVPAANDLITRPVAPQPILSLVSKHTDLPTQQVAQYAGGRLSGASGTEVADLSIATSILSNRLFDNLREREGLAYSTGASARFEKDFGWYYLVISSATDKYERARDGLGLQADKLAFDGPTVDEVRRAKNEVWGRLMSAKLSRINQAYYMAVDEFLGYLPGHDADFVASLGQVNAYTVRAVASKYFRPSAWVVCSAGAK